jgi:putative oxidoreductase
MVAGDGGGGAPRPVRGGRRLSRTAADLALLLLRLSGLGLAVVHGLPKVLRLFAGDRRFIEGVSRMGFPLPEAFAWAAALSEALGGLLLALGLGTRVMAGFCAATMFVAAFMRHQAHEHLRVALGLRQVEAKVLEGWGNPELALVYLAVFVSLALLGGGRFALERVFGGKRARR